MHYLAKHMASRTGYVYALIFSQLCDAIIDNFEQFMVIFTDSLRLHLLSLQQRAAAMRYNSVSPSRRLCYRTY